MTAVEASGAPLGTIARNASRASQSQTGKERRDATIARRFALQRASARLLRAERVCVCCRSIIPGREAVDVLYDPAHQAGHYAGLLTCGSVWLCPVCSAKITERRRVELSQGVAAWRELGEDHQIALVTLTLSHHKGENLSTVLKTLQEARRNLVSGRSAVDFNSAWGIEGQVRALEITYGDNGWHPHMHILYFINGCVDAEELTIAMKAKWSSAVASLGGYASITHGCDVRFTDAQAQGSIDDYITDYIAKFGREPKEIPEQKWTAEHEVTKSPSKMGKWQGRTPFQLLSDYNEGDDEAGRLWIQYAANFKGQRQLFWSHGLRKKLGLNVEKSDEELAAEVVETSVILASLGVGAWRVVLRHDARAQLLQIAAGGDKEAVSSFLMGLGIEGAALPSGEIPQIDVTELPLPAVEESHDAGDVFEDVTQPGAATAGESHGAGHQLADESRNSGRVDALRERFAALYEKAAAQQRAYDAARASRGLESSGTEGCQAQRPPAMARPPGRALLGVDSPTAL